MFLFNCFRIRVLYCYSASDVIQRCYLAIFSQQVPSFFYTNRVPYVSAVLNSFGLLLGQLLSTGLAITIALLCPLVLGLMFGGCPSLRNMNSFESTIASYSPTRYVLESLVVFEKNACPKHLQDMALDHMVDHIGYDLSNIYSIETKLRFVARA